MSDSVGEDYCASGANSTGVPARLTGSGTAIIANADLVLRVVDLPLNTTGFFITSSTQGFVVSPAGSSGNLCLGGAIGRFLAPGQAQDSGASGEFTLAVDASQLPTPTGVVTAVTGETWSFQAWYRDVIVGLGFPISNFTNGLEVTFF